MVEGHHFNVKIVIVCVGLCSYITDIPPTLTQFPT